ncbi:MAG: alpha/beta hydrolase [Anaerolineales bacterium]|jgi:pimeloyl-ACP methyl ester carboxylesterase|nr:alpha/beta hydrolase [Anaerolineales bacterium]
MNQLNYLRAGSGQPLVLIHGFPLDHSLWEPLLPHLTGQFDVILPDLCGFGASALPESGCRIDEMAASLGSLLLELDLPQVFLAGHSMGGYVALAFARQFPRMLLGLGLISTQTLPDDAGKQAGRHKTAAEVEQQGSAALAEAMSSKLSANPAHAGLLREVILRQPVAGIANGLKAMASRPDSSEVLAGLGCPVSILHGLADALIPPERAREMKAALPSATLTELSGVGHMPMLEAPAETAEALKSLKS